jgi:hypothetical protein
MIYAHNDGPYPFSVKEILAGRWTVDFMVVGTHRKVFRVLGLVMNMDCYCKYPRVKQDEVSLIPQTNLVRSHVISLIYISILSIFESLIVYTTMFCWNSKLSRDITLSQTLWIHSYRMNDLSLPTRFQSLLAFNIAYTQ